MLSTLYEVVLPTTMPGLASLTVTSRKPHIFNCFTSLSSVPALVFTNTVPPAASRAVYADSKSKSNSVPPFPATPDRMASYNGGGSAVATENQQTERIILYSRYERETALATYRGPSSRR